MKQTRPEWKRVIEEPVTQPSSYDPGGDGATTTTHPSYGQIGASRISGGKALYGSDFNHAGYVRITLKRSELRRSLASDWPYAGEQLFSVDMSEAQWVNFVSAMNIGDGTRCTINWTQKDGPVPEIPAPVDRRSQFADESAKTAEKVVLELGKLEAMLRESGLSNKKLEAFIGNSGAITKARQAALGNQQYVAKRFEEHMETTVQKAATEVNAYVNAAVRQVGLDNLQKVGMAQQILPQWSGHE